MSKTVTVTQSTPKWITTTHFKGKALTNDNVREAEAHIADFVQGKVLSALKAQDRHDERVYGRSMRSSITAANHLRSVEAKNFVTYERNVWKSHSQIFEVSVLMGYDDHSGTSGDDLAVAITALQKLIGHGQGPVQVFRGPEKLTGLRISPCFDEIRGSGITDNY